MEKTIKTMYIIAIIFWMAGAYMCYERQEYKVGAIMSALIIVFSFATVYDTKEEN
jgi:hypothetical protein